MRLLLALCLAVAALAREPRRPAARRRRSRSSPPRTSGAASPRSSAATARRCGASSPIPRPIRTSYEPTPSDARTFAGAKIAIVNGIGYDTWASQLLAADRTAAAPSSTSATCSDWDGDNPHQWYSPAAVRKVVDAIAAAYVSVDPATRRYFAARKRRFETAGRSRRYNALRAEIHRRFAGVPVGYSESIFEPLGTSLGLRLLTPAGLRQGGRRGQRGQRRATRQTVERQLRRAPGQGLGLQQPERRRPRSSRLTPSRAPSTSRSRRSPRRSRPRRSTSSSGRRPSSRG